MGLALVVGIELIHLGSGTVRLTPDEVAHALLGRPEQPWHEDIVVGLRLPRGLVAITAGAMLGAAGAMLQAVTRNALADPGLLGISSGAALAIVLAASWGGGGMSVGSPWAPLVATGGAVVVGAVVFWLGWRQTGSAAGGGTDVMVLNGLMITASVSALISVILTLDGSVFGTVLRWLVGTLHATAWQDWDRLWPWAVVGLVAVAASLRAVTVLWAGAEVATTVGVEISRARMVVFAAAAVLSAGAVCAVGAIAFVGLVAAHLVRPLVGSHPVRLLPMAAVAGALLLLGADTIANVLSFAVPDGGIAARASLPTGAVTALVGGPLLLALVLKETR
ncbi:iron ABC transporter permease [Nocardioides sp. R-C-SC26]|uniref:FecCD family ABC transporter permease n=1 Tax=Nocardioides sp. R-C-SC26 TaxID=2870414 RepID=UPI001E367B77|nr:iron ABC transporter permease [Nocardioides sp. R-C-SC26]